VTLDFTATARALREEAHPAKDGHRQISLAHRGSLRVLLFSFEAGGELPAHQAPGHVLIQCLSGSLSVHAAGARHVVAPGQALLLDPDVAHDVAAAEASDMLLTVCRKG
jgi:quercetin dioxygenase-like cupin family protein